MARTQDIDAHGWSAAAPDTLYALLADGSTWPLWSGIGSFELREPGDAHPEGLGAIRVFRTGRTTSVERVVERTPGRRFSYELLEGMPLRGYHADVELEPDGTGTAIRWHSTFQAGRPGTGWLYRLMLGRFIRDCVKGLAVYATVPAEAAD